MPSPLEKAQVVVGLAGRCARARRAPDRGDGVAEVLDAPDRVVAPTIVSRGDDVEFERLRPNVERFVAEVCPVCRLL